MGQAAADLPLTAEQFLAWEASPTISGAALWDDVPA
jgi:hypothetical protein